MSTSGILAESNTQTLPTGAAIKIQIPVQGGMQEITLPVKLVTVSGGGSGTLTFESKTYTGTGTTGNNVTLAAKARVIYVVSATTGDNSVITGTNATYAVFPSGGGDTKKFTSTILNSTTIDMGGFDASAACNVNAVAYTLYIIEDTSA